MAGNRNGSRLARERRAEQFGRKSVAASLVQALRHTRASNSKGSRTLGVTARTMRNWLKLETPIAVELIANVPGLAETFASCLSVLMKRRARAEKRNGGR